MSYLWNSLRLSILTRFIPHLFLPVSVTFFADEEGEIRTRTQIENRRQQMLSRLQQLLTELHDAGPMAEQHVRSQFDLHAAETELKEADTAVQMMEASTRVQRTIDQGRMALDQYVAEELAKIAAGEPKEGREEERREGVRRPELNEDTMLANIRQLEEALNAERKRMDEYQRIKIEREQRERNVEEIRQQFHIERTETDLAPVLDNLMAYLAHLELKIDNNTATLESVLRLVKGKGKVSVEEEAKGKEKKEPQEKLLKGAMKRTTLEKSEGSKREPEEPAGKKEVPTEKKEEPVKEAQKPKKKEKVKMKLSFTYSNKKEENLLLWIAEIQTYCGTTPVEPESQVAFSTSCLGGVAKKWVLAEANAVPGLNLQDNQVLYIYSHALPEPIRGQLVAESKSGKYNYQQLRDLALQRKQMTAQVKGSYASVVKSGTVGGYGKRVLWRRKRQDHMLVVFDDDTVKKLPLEDSEGGGGTGSSESEKGDVTAVVANKEGQSQWKKRRRPRSFLEHPGIAFGRP
ncbi:hypothetical protein CBR_g26162 [Chara braunii]|uniref:Uncharacterized protein n=1 Tax=Chara braunii TaxID=69332 RepID=A0A388L745_CHABU|nr:hypothetical protein CBR_g26162 [Chara braunii]|eukprot:GBG78125.1 hypothetical protein CBR_g26162 [Chara braunii]